MPLPETQQVFERERRRLAGLAYRMTGSVSETEDILQDAALKLQSVGLSGIERPAQWLSTVVTRLCLDHLRSAQKRRETYVGAWLPEPIVTDHAADAESDWILTEDVGIALLLTLDRLSPEMRAAFILRDGFDYSFEDISAVVGQSSANCRQLVSRARRKLAGADQSTPERAEETHPLVAAFWAASREGDMDRLLEIFAEDIEVHTDGGGKVPAAINVLRGSRNAARFFEGLARKGKLTSGPVPRPQLINGATGYVVRENGVLQTTAFAVHSGKIKAIWIVRNPEKLRHVHRAEDESTLEGSRPPCCSAD